VTTAPGPAPSASMVRDAARGLSPAYFALVMATGIVSLAAHQLGLARIAEGLFWLNVAAYVVIWLLTVLRVAWYPRELWRDLVDHRRGPGFFTTVAASGVLATQFALLAHDYVTAKLLWVVAVALWAGLTYAVFAAFTVKREKPPLEEGVSGTWLLAVVAMQSIAVLSACLAAQPGEPHRLVLDFLALAMWLAGGMLYIWTISLIFYRTTFFRFAPADLTPPYWISMGAMAISTLAGSFLILNARDAPFLASLLPFLEGFTVFYWATGTWWIPLLVVLAVWRHAYARFPLRYDPSSWGAVFPLGMYAACTFEMARAMELDFLAGVPRGFFYVALAAWALAFAGVVRALAAAVVRRFNRAFRRAAGG